MTVPVLPLPVAELPEAIRKFGNPAAPAGARAMAARGLVPVRGADLVTLLVQLASDPDDAIRESASKTLAGVPRGVVLSACDDPLHPAILDALADHFRDDDGMLEQLAMNHGTLDSTVQRIALRCSEHLSEVIAVNQQRLLGAPKIIEALYKNAATRMSTADRLIELCARNGVQLDGIPSFDDHVEAIRGQLIPEPSDEPLPDDLEFREALSVDADEDATEHDPDKDEEKLKEKFLPLRTRIEKMKKQDKIRLAAIGSAAARSILVRDPNKAVSRAAINSPRVTAGEAAAFTQSREISEDILRTIGNKKKWLSSYEVKRGLVFNPKTPVGLALQFLAHMRDNDLKTLTRSRNVPGPIKMAALQRQNQKTKGRRG